VAADTPNQISGEIVSLELSPLRPWFGDAFASTVPRPPFSTWTIWGWS